MGRRAPMAPNRPFTLPRNIGSRGHSANVELTRYSLLGGGNIGDKGIDPTTRTDTDIVPEAAVHVPEDEDVHTGRGGAGNIHLGPEHKKKKVTDGIPHEEASLNHGSVADKLKHKVLGVFKK